MSFASQPRVSFLRMTSVLINRKQAEQEVLRLARVALKSRERQKLACSIHTDFMQPVDGINRRIVAPSSGPRPGVKFTLHAEEDAVRALRLFGFNPSNFEIVVVRVNRRGQLRLARPCQACFSMLSRRGVRQIWWSTGDNTRVEGTRV